MIKSAIVAKNFSKTPDFYNYNAEIQRYAAGKLFDEITDNFTTKPCKILELGCGTGFLTEKLMRKFTSAEFTINDISEEMLRFCKNSTEKCRLRNNITTHFILSDITESLPDGKFDIITSSLAFQWVEDLQSLIQRLAAKLTPKGVLIFSTLSQGTFQSVKQIFKKNNIYFPGPKLLNNAEIKSICRNNISVVKLKNEIVKEEFDSMLSFLHHVQGTGAGNATGNYTKSSDLKKLLRNDKEKIKAEYNITYIIAGNLKSLPEITH